MRKVPAWPAMLIAVTVAMVSPPTASVAAEPAVADVEIFSAYYTIAPVGWAYTVFDVILVGHGPDLSTGVVLRLTGLDPSIGAGYGYGFPDTCQFVADGARCTFENSLGGTTFKVPVCTSDRPVDITVTKTSTDPDLSNNVKHVPGVTPQESVALARCPAYAGTPTPTPTPSAVATTAASGSGGSGGNAGGSGGGQSGIGTTIGGTDPSPTLSPGVIAVASPTESAKETVASTNAATEPAVPIAARSNPGGWWSWGFAGAVGAITIVAALAYRQRWRRRSAGQPTKGS